MADDKEKVRRGAGFPSSCSRLPDHGYSGIYGVVKPTTARGSFSGVNCSPRCILDATEDLASFGDEDFEEMLEEIEHELNDER